MKVVRVFIASPVDVSWSDFGKTLRDIQQKTSRALNHCMTEWYLWQREKEGIKQVEGKYPPLKEFPYPTNRLYAEIRSMFPDLSSRMMTAIANKSKQRWQTDVKDVFYYQNKSLPSFRKTHPVIIDGQAYEFSKDEINRYVFTGTLKSGKAPKEERRVTFILNTKKLRAAQKSILDNIISKEYRRGEATIGFNERKRKWFLNITYEPPKKDLKLNPDRIIGVDFGINSAFFCAVSDSPKRLSADGWEIENFRKKIRKRRISIQRQGKFSSRKGRGRNNILDPVTKLSEKERRFRDTRYHHFSKAIVEFAVANEAGTIQVEELSSLKSLKQEKAILRDWALGDLQTKLKYKAEEHGITIVEVNPRHTSKRCSACGYIDSKNRDQKDTEKFVCISCGNAENADYNAAKNLSIRGIDAIITKEIANPEDT